MMTANGSKKLQYVNATMEDVYEGTVGGCMACGELKYGGVEPDARGYECDECGDSEVYGLEELVIMGQLNLVDAED